MTQIWRTFLIVMLAATTLVACGSGDEAEECVTTNDAARQGLVTRMHQSADALPWPVTLVEQYPGEPSAILPPSPVPNNTDDTDPEQPYSWSFPRWVLLPPGVTAAQATDAFNQNWRKQGFAVTERATGSVQAKDSDGYVYVTKTSVEGAVSLNLISPCFPKSQLDESGSWPDRIESNG